MSKNRTNEEKKSNMEDKLFHLSTEHMDEIKREREKQGGRHS